MNSKRALELYFINLSAGKEEAFRQMTDDEINDYKNHLLNLEDEDTKEELAMLERELSSRVEQ